MQLKCVSLGKFHSEDDVSRRVASIDIFYVDPCDEIHCPASTWCEVNNGRAECGK